MRLEEEVGERCVRARQRHVPVELALQHDVPHQRVAVGVQAAARHAPEDVAGLDPRAVDDAVALDGADDEPGDVVVAECVHAGHLRGLAADQRAAGVAARRGDAVDHLGEVLGHQLAGGVVVEEEERLARRSRGCR